MDPLFCPQGESSLKEIYDHKKTLAILIMLAAFSAIPNVTAHDNTECTLEDYVCTCTRYTDYDASTGRYYTARCEGDIWNSECLYGVGATPSMMIGFFCYANS
jgi:hypothetical protein